MKIAFIIDIYPTISTFILNQITGLIDLEHEVYVFARYKNDQKGHEVAKKYTMEKRVFYPEKYETNRRKKYSELFFSFVKYFHKTPLQILNCLNIFRYGRSAINLTKFYQIKQYIGKQFDIIQVHYGVYGDEALLLKEMGWRAKIVTMFHGFDIRKGIDEGGHIYKELFEKGDLFLAISQYNKEKLIGFGLAKNKIVYHPVGIDISLYTYKERVIKENERIVILSVGRLVWEKGYEFGIEAINLLKDEYKNFEYRIIGEGYERTKIEKIIKEKNLESFVKLLGAKIQSEVIEELNAAHLFFMPSVAEVLPLSIMEAMASGLPVVATNVGSISELIIDSENGLLAESKNSTDIYQKLKILFTNKKAWEKYAKKGQSHIKHQFDITKLNSKLANIYQQSLI